MTITPDTDVAPDPHPSAPVPPDSEVPERGRVLGIETSCDETAAAIVERGTNVLSSVVSSQVDLHARYGGVVPEIASRAHVDLLVPVLAQAFVEAGCSDSPQPDGGADVDAVAATYGPGLVGSLLIGVSAAKALSLAWGVPFIAVNHLEAHLYASFLEEPDLELPLLVVLVSGGHTLFVHMADHGRYEVLGGTIDDAAGEAFDKVARYLGLGYPGGPAIDRLSIEGDPEAIRFPRPLLDGSHDVSFSGLKTAVVNHVRKHPEVSSADVAASFQEAVVDVLITKARAAAREVGAKGLCLGGGVAANSRLRERFLDLCVEEGIRGFLPSRALCTDNAAMVAAAAWHRWRSDGPSPLDLGAVPNLGL
jgi:N6-L-threonylcarbamoyladenine synthase